MKAFLFAMIAIVLAALLIQSSITASRPVYVSVSVECGGCCQQSADPAVQESPVTLLASPSATPTATLITATSTAKFRDPATGTPQPTATDVPPTIVPPTIAPPTIMPPTIIPPATKHACNKGGGNGSEGCDPGNRPKLGHDDE